MVAKPKSDATARPRRNVNNLYNRLEEARNRRAEVLAHKEPANDAPRRPIEVARDARSGKLQMSRFPKIVMPPAEDPKVDIDPPAERSKRPMVILALLTAAALAAVYFATPNRFGSTQIASIEAPPVPLDDATLTALGAENDRSPQQVPAPLFAQITSPATPPRQDPVGRLPQVYMVAQTLETPLTSASQAAPTPETTVLRATNVPLLTAPIDELPFALNTPTALRVSLSIPVRAATSETNAVLRALEQSGFEVSAPRRVNFTVRDTQVRFFHTSDATAAKRLAEDIGGIARDFTSFTPSPPPAFVEVYVSGRNAPAGPAPAASRGLADDIRQLSENIGNALRSISR